MRNELLIEYPLREPLSSVHEMVIDSGSIPLGMQDRRLARLFFCGQKNTSG
jgi:hypothetical protein